MEACPNARDRATALLPSYACLRVSEVAGLDVDDITMSARKGSIRVAGKGEKTRTVPIHPELREALTASLFLMPDAEVRSWGPARGHSVQGTGFPHSG